MSERYNNVRGVFQDLEDETRFWQPNIIIRAADFNQTFLTDRKLVADSDIWYPGYVRRVIYRVGGLEYPMELVPYIHPTGASAITLGSIAYSAENVGTYTPALQNRLLLWTGALAGAGALTRTIAGMMFADYYWHWDDNQHQMDLYHATTINAGDFLWLVRRGLITMDYAGAVADDGAIITAANGEVDAAPAIDTSSVANLSTTLLGHLENQNFAKKVGEARETVSGAGQYLTELMLPRDYRQVS